MRVTNNMLLNAAIYDLDKLRESYAKAQAKVNGRSLERPSDDPVRVVEAIDLTGAQMRLERAQRSAEDASEWLAVTETSLSKLIDQVAAAKETAMQAGAPSSLEETARESLATTIDSLAKAYYDELNVSHRGHYLYGGWKSDQAPFTKDGTGTVTYTGDNQEIVRHVAPGFEISISVPGSRLMAAGDFVKTLTDMAQHLRSGEMTTVITDDMNKIDQVMNHLISVRSTFGLRMQQVEQYEAYARDGLINIEDRLGKISGGDLAEASMKMIEAQNAYQVAVASFSKALPVSLLDYMFR